jgi:uncharacterized membrane protein
MAWLDALKEPGALHRLFRIGVILKGAHALLELAGAILIYFTSNSTLYGLVVNAVQSELLEDPNDILATFFLQHASGIASEGKDFAALYLFVGAMVNGMLAVGLLSEKRAVFPVSLVVLGLFVLYQLYLFARTLSPWLPLFALFDLLVMCLVGVEYARLRRSRPEPSATT